MNQEYKKLYKDLIAEKCKTTIIDYDPCNKKYQYQPFSHSVSPMALDNLYDLVIDNVVFYTFSEDEIIKLQNNISLLADLRSAAKYAFAERLPKRKAADSDGTLGEVLLDLLIQVFEPASQKLIARAKHIEVGKKSEITGYDALYFTKQGDEITLWLGQAKAGQESYCKRDIKKDLNEKFQTDYFTETAFYIADKSDCYELTSLLNEINKICLDTQKENLTKVEKSTRLYQLLSSYNVSVKIPCLIAYTKDIYNSGALKDNMDKLRDSIINTFENSNFDININLPYGIRFYIFPIKDVSYIREKIVAFKREVI